MNTETRTPKQLATEFARASEKVLRVAKRTHKKADNYHEIVDAEIVIQSEERGISVDHLYRIIFGKKREVESFRTNQLRFSWSA